METHKPIMSTALKAITCFLLLTLTFTSVTSARMLYNVELPAPTEGALEPSNPIDAPMTKVTLLGAPPTEDPVETPNADVSSVAPIIDIPSMVIPSIEGQIGTPTDDVPPTETTESSGLLVAPVADVPHSAAAPTADSTLTTATTATYHVDPNHPMSFYMENILTGSNPSPRAVAGVVSNQVAKDPIPLSKSNGSVPPGNSGVPLKNANYRIIESKNLQLHTVLIGTKNSMIHNNTKNMKIGGDELQLGKRAQPSLQRVMFGTMNVFDVELTGELGSGLVGKAQGFYVVSSEDASSHTMMFTAIFNSENYADTLSFFGVRHTAVSESQLAIMGGTGKYINAKGFAAIKVFPTTSHSTTDEATKLLQFSVFLA